MALASLAQAFTDGTDSGTQPFTFTGVDESFNVIVPETRLQYWPSSISVSGSVEYATQNIMGGSHPVYGWISNSGRAFTFSFQAGRDMPVREQLPVLAGLVLDPQSERLRSHNMDLRQFIDRLWAMVLPDYTTVEEVRDVARPPPVGLFRAPGLGWSLDSDDPDRLIGLITSLSVNYLRTFDNGEPRLVSFDLSVNEMVQRPDRATRFFGRRDLERRPWFNNPDRR